MGIFDNDKKKDVKEEKKYSIKELKAMANLLRDLVGKEKKK